MSFGDNVADLGGMANRGMSFGDKESLRALRVSKDLDISSASVTAS